MDNHGTLVGWTHTDLGSRMMINLESVQTVEAAQAHAPDVTRLLITKSQAAVLGNYLLKVSGHTAPERPTLFRRLFG